MNAQTAETLLRCYRPGKPADSRTQKAVRFAETDPELQPKLAAQLEFDQQIVSVIHFIKPPDNLRQKLNDLTAAPTVAKTKLRSQIINPAILTALLGVLLIIGVVVFIVLERMEKFPGREAVESLLGGAAKMTGVELETVTTTTSQLEDWLYMRGYEGYEVPPELATLPVVGSRVFRNEGRPVAQLAVDHHNSLVYQFHASEFGVQLPSDGGWQVLTKDDWVGAIRQHGDHCFLVAFRGTKSDMDDFLKTLPKK
jgi:hypothetical protein